MSNNNTFSFGAPASSGTSGGGLFSSSSPFGSNQGTNTGGNMFGGLGGASSGTASPSLFGTANASSGQKPLFGANTSAGTGSTPTFSFGTQNQDKSSATTGGSPFGTTQTPNKTSEASAPSQTQTSALFGSKPGGGLFGSNTPVQPKAGPTLFSTTPANPPPAGTSSGPSPALFGAQKPLSGGLTSQPATTTSTATTQPQAPTLFGQHNAISTKPLFGAGATPSSTSGGNLFGGFNTNKTPISAPSQTQSPATTSNDGGNKPLFGGGAPATSTTTTQAPSNLFKFPSGNAASTSPFGAASPAAAPSSQPVTTPAASAAPQKPLFGGLGGASPITPSAPQVAPSLFSGLGKPASPAVTTTSSAAATSGPTQTQGTPSGGILFGAKPAVTSTSTTAGAPATTTTGAATAPVSAPATAPSATIGVAGAGAGAAKGPSSQAPNLGASTLGPTPPAQSRLKNKTMDEIITRWATDLTKYQKDFREQAEKVAEWDRMLVVNGTKVQKLYGHTVDAERATQEVERQLASVESQQEELNAWLDRYEREVDEMMSKQVGPGETLQGPDQERERTYELAEKLSERLDEMGKDLGSMIEEINNASSSLSKTNKTDEPISQIVRILNSHLSQLQMIDKGTTDLQTKINTAQKAGQSLGSRLGGYAQNGNSIGVGGSAADDFYRSYMGRR